MRFSSIIGMVIGIRTKAAPNAIIVLQLCPLDICGDQTFTRTSFAVVAPASMLF